MAINCRAFGSYLGDLFIPARAWSKARAPGDYFEKMGMLNMSLWGAVGGCGASILVFKFTVEKTIPNTIAKFGLPFYASVAVLSVVVSFAKFCMYQANQRP